MRSALRAFARELGHRRWFARLGRLLAPADRLAGRLTGGRLVALGRQWPAYQTYAERAGQRELYVFRLQPTAKG